MDNAAGTFELAAAMDMFRQQHFVSYNYKVRNVVNNLKG